MEFTKHPPATPPKSVNDVAAPAPPQPASPQSPAASKPDDMTVHEQAATGATDAQDEKSEHKADVPKPVKAKVQKQKGTGTGLAITASVLIVLGLGALMTYAYLRSQNISIF